MIPPWFQAVGFGFRDWLAGESLSDWNSIAGPCEAALAGLNNAYIQKVSASGSVERPQPAEVILAGFVQGVGKVLYLDCEGVHSFLEDGPHFFGLRARHAIVAWGALSRFAKLDGNRSLAFECVIEATIETLQGLGGPIQSYELMNRGA